jgi:hypothetical protein
VVWFWRDVFVYCISLILAMMTITYIHNNVIILFNFGVVIFMISFLLTVFSYNVVGILMMIIYCTLMGILFMVNGIFVMYSLSFRCDDELLCGDFGLLMNNYYLVYSCVVYLYLFLWIRYLDYFFIVYFGFLYWFHFTSNCIKGVGSIVFGNYLVMIIVLFFIVGMVNIGILFWF